MNLALENQQNFVLDAAQEACINGYPEIAEDLLLNKNQNDPRVRFNMGWHTLRHGQLSKGMEMLDAGRFIKCYGSEFIEGRVIYNPAQHEIKGKTILLRSEGGYGDEIIGARFAKILAERGAKVILSCHPTLMSLLSRVEGVTICVSSAAVRDCHYDYWLPAMSAPHVLGLEFDTLPGDPYLNVIPELKNRWAKTIKGKFKLGLRWKGSPKFEHQQFRTFDPAMMFDLANFDKVTAYSLQRDDGAELLPQDSPIIDLASLLQDWETTAAIISNLDLVITSCTSIAHLAGALGIPTWVIIPVMPYYTWAHPWGGTTSPWYKNCLKLYRQKKFNEWDIPFQKIKEDLNLLLSGNK